MQNPSNAVFLPALTYFGSKIQNVCFQCLKVSGGHPDFWLDFAMPKDLVNFFSTNEALKTPEVVVMFGGWDIFMDCV